jgi:hypothetical protein
MAKAQRRREVDAAAGGHGEAATCTRSHGIPVLAEFLS